MSKTAGMEGNPPATANEHDDEKQEHAVGMDEKSKADISFPTVKEVMQMKG